MLSKAETEILKILNDCKEMSENSNCLINISEKIMYKPNFKEYDAALKSLNRNGYFDEYTVSKNGIEVSLSTKGFNYKSDTRWGIAVKILKELIIPVAVGVFSSFLTAKLL